MGIKRQVFYSFHYKNDVFRVQQVRNIGALEENEPVSANEWEQIRRGGDKAIEKWIDENMKYRSCVIVLVGSETAKRRWVDYEIRKAWNEGKKLLGIHIHNLRDPRTSGEWPFYGKSPQGINPFMSIGLSNGNRLSNIVPCYNPNKFDAYNDIRNNIETWVENAKSR